MKEESGGEAVPLPPEERRAAGVPSPAAPEERLCLQGGDDGITHFRRIHADFSGSSRSQVARAAALVNHAANGGVNGVCRCFSPRE